MSCFHISAVANTAAVNTGGRRVLAGCRGSEVGWRPGCHRKSTSFLSTWMSESEKTWAINGWYNEGKSSENDSEYQAS